MINAIYLSYQRSSLNRSFTVAHKKLAATTRDKNWEKCQGKDIDVGERYIFFFKYGKYKHCIRQKRRGNGGAGRAAGGVGVTSHF